MTLNLYIKGINFSILFLFLNLDLGAQTNLPKPIANLLDVNKLTNIKPNKSTGEIRSSKENGAYELDIITKTYVNEAYELNTKIPTLPKTLKKNQKVLIEFEAKSISSTLETGESKCLWQVRISDQMSDHMNKIVSIGQEWKKYAIPYEIIKTPQPINFAIIMQFGFPPQHFKLKNVSISLYDVKTPYSALPKTIITYPGMEANAQWRMEAVKRIEQHRQGNIEIVVQKNGKPVKDAKVAVNMLQHQFRWGAAVRAANIIDNEKEQQLLAKTFNHIVLENDLKMKFWNKNPPKKEVLRCIDQLISKNMTIKGHALIWPGFRHLPEDYQKMQSDKNKVQEMVNNHLTEILNETNNKIIRWDVVNEVYSNQDLQKITGSEQILYDAFKLMKNKYPSIKRNVNEFGIISRGGLNKEKQDWYYDFVKRIDAAVPNAVDGIGMQSHIGTDLTPPEKVYSIIDRFAGLNKKICISEFTLDIDNPLVRQMYTEDFLIIAFSHPAVDEFLFWGYKGASDSKVDIYDNNGNIGSMGKGFMNLVHGLWKTNYSNTSNKDGQSIGRGFFGSYEVKISIDGKTISKKFNHLKEGKTKVIVEL